MKYTTEIEIKAPLEKVAAMLGDHEQMLKWIKEVESYQPISGTPRQEGAKTLLHVNAGKQMEVTETITKVNFPYRFTAHYEMPDGSLVIDNMLQASTPALTRYVLNHYFKFNGTMKVVTALLKPAFVKHSERMMKDFKELAEG